jgi:uncharacterized protein with FMN-binding domain
VKRAPFVVGATGVGLGLVLSYHTHPVTVVSLPAPVTAPPETSPTSSAVAGPTTAPTTRAPSTTAPPTTARTVPSAGTSPATTPIPTAAPATAAPTTGAPTTAPPTTAPPTTATTRTATGDDVVYAYGDIQLQVTTQGRRITEIQVLTNNAADPRSAEINSWAVPQLQQQAMAAQSANIDGVSGATFTSMAYEQSLQSALDRVG